MLKEQVNTASPQGAGRDARAPSVARAVRAGTPALPGFYALGLAQTSVVRYNFTRAGGQFIFPGRRSYNLGDIE